jgi:hypothetical protein
LSRDSQLRHQGSVDKALVGPRINKHLERFGLVTPQQGGMESVARVMGDWKIPIRLTRVLVTTGQPGLFNGQVEI